ncbi:MauE/DoxX family redox-associated membrane protein [Cohnella faecalis]|uniref:Methylamine utilisation protein MauE domain-containing protein n=1 Tax=Cohnella faecalis TaxID=2315694 RepID=A0A398CXB8_9BACL|nr:MauE/DoxX family redox-associated membrane protein [Cohnella faecalis]RIE05228.1 hypothetical protein D3H35_01525 [Cohnella faecalis]
MPTTLGFLSGIAGNEWLHPAKLSSYVFEFVFALSAISKMMDLASFRRAVTDFRIVGADKAHGAANAVVVSEGLIGLGLLIVPGETVLLAAAWLMLGSFTWLAAKAWRRQLHIDCSCFGSRNRPTRWGLAFIRNVTLILTASVGCCYSNFDVPVTLPNVIFGLSILCGVLMHVSVREAIGIYRLNRGRGESWKI